MFAPVYAALFAAILFYAVLPVIGGIVVRRQWRVFRAALMASLELPELRYGMREADGTSAPGPVPAPHRVRFTGRVDALGGDDELWIRSESVTAAVQVGKARVFTLAGGAAPDGMTRLHWSSIRSVAPGTRALVAGRARRADGKTVIGSADEPPLVLLHDGDDASMPERAIRAGRHSNEYWNPLTQVSLAMGVLAMSGIVSVSLSGGAPAMVTAVILTAAFSPLLPLLPPGLLLFFAYRFWWKRGWECRARRDLALLRREERAHRAWRFRSILWTGAAALSFVAAFTINAWLAIAAFRILL